MKKLLLWCTVFLLLGIGTSTAQTTLRHTFEWSETPTSYRLGEQIIEQWSFPEAKFGDIAPSLPYWTERFPVSGPGALRVQVSSLQLEDFEKVVAAEDERFGESLIFTTSVVRTSEGYFGKVACVPFVKIGDRYQRVKSFALSVTQQPKAAARGGDPFNSALSQNPTYKIAISNTGIHKLTYGFLKDDLGISNLDDVDPRTIKVYGNGGGLVPYDVNEERADDVVENAIQIVGEEDGSFDSGDYILLYAQGPDRWRYDADDDRFDLEVNVYDSRNYYFVQTGGANGLRVQSQSNLSTTTYSTDTYDGLFRFEEDRVNVLHEIESTGTGTGQHWYGDFFKFAREKEYDKLFTFPGLQTNEPVIVRSEMALRAATGSRFFLDIADQTLTSQSVPRVPIGERNEIYSNLAPTARLNDEVTLTGEEFTVLLRYPNPGGGEQSSAWLDFIQARPRMALRYLNEPTRFRDTRSLGQESTTFTLNGVSSGIEVWDISSVLQPQRQEVNSSGSSMTFGVSTQDVLREFIAFNPNDELLNAEVVGEIPNQNLHSLAGQDMIIVYHPDFQESAERIATHRREFSGLEVALVPTTEVYNEFSSGRVSPTAIRDFAKCIFDRDQRLGYLLLIGDGSFDCRDLYGFGGNFVPVYQRDQNHELFGFPADDFFAIFENDPGDDPLANDLSISVGRLPVKTLEEANVVVNKIINYDTNPEYLLNWRTRMIFLGDDEDGATHSDDAEEASRVVRNLRPEFNLTKLFFDLFPQESTPAGDRFPIVEEELDRILERGSVVTTYLGHGGPRGWAQERVLDIPQIQNWDNLDRLSIFLTATCTFGDYDNGAFVSAGEELLLTPRGGAVALMTTTRPVFASRNSALTNRSLTQLLNQDEDGNWTRLGDVVRVAKNALSNPSSFDNERKFMLMGDPAQRPALPRFRVKTNTINGIDPASGILDTLSALETVTITGQIEDGNGQIMSGFNGLVYPTIFDKSIGAETLQNDPEGSPARTYDVRRNVLFRGKASVVDGQFTFSFVVPKDINYNYGPGKISYYAADIPQKIDAGGGEERFIIGGSNPDGVVDDTPPVVEVFMNSTDFISGGQVDANPTLVVRLSDDFGINVTGNSIGHDLEGFLNEDTQNSYLLNDFYQTENNDFRRGEVRFPLRDLEPGTYNMRVRAWDVANNLGEGVTEFVVANDGKIALQNVLNYPNPFTDRTCFQFDTNIAGEDLDVLIQVFTISGRLVKTIEEMIPANDGALRLDDCIEWDGRDDYGDQLARGVYLYQVRVRTASGTEINGESEFEKLVILK
ncbi:MAG: type IX secretion system sortase PorU [Bacteroidota bacterium]